MAEEKKDQETTKDAAATEEPKKEAVATETASQPETPKEEPAALKGLIGTKIGMTRIFVSDTEMVPVTVISSAGLIVSQVKTLDTDGYNAVQVSYGDVTEKKVNKPKQKVFAKRNIPLKRFMKEFRVDDVSNFKIGQKVLVSSFTKGERVNVSGLSKGKGFTGTVKRFGFGGGPHSHGHGEYRRAPGSSGGQGPQRVLPGTRKPGHKGHVQKTSINCEVADIDLDQNLILIKGSIPGPNGNLVEVKPTK